MSGDIAVVASLLLLLYDDCLAAGATSMSVRESSLPAVDFRRGRRLGKYDHLIVWTRPQRPEWMDEATYDSIPETLELREIRYNMVEPGSRTQTITITTTLTDASLYRRRTSPNSYGFRWNCGVGHPRHQVQP